MCDFVCGGQLWALVEDPGCNVATALRMRMLVAVLYKCIFGTQLSPRLAMALSEEDWRIETGRHELP